MFSVENNTISIDGTKLDMCLKEVDPTILGLNNKLLKFITKAAEYYRGSSFLLYHIDEGFPKTIEVHGINRDTLNLLSDAYTEILFEKYGEYIYDERFTTYTILFDLDLSNFIALYSDECIIFHDNKAFYGKRNKE